MSIYPVVDTEISGYVVAVQYDCDGLRLRLPGSHDDFGASRDRARRVAAALREAGETGVRGCVVYAGERPAHFPRNGVAA